MRRVLFDSEHELFRETVRDFIGREIAPLRKELALEPAPGLIAPLGDVPLANLTPVARSTPNNRHDIRLRGRDPKESGRSGGGGP